MALEGMVYGYHILDLGKRLRMKGTLTIIEGYIDNENGIYEKVSSLSLERFSCTILP